MDLGDFSKLGPQWGGGGGLERAFSTFQSLGSCAWALAERRLFLQDPIQEEVKPSLGRAGNAKGEREGRKGVLNTDCSLQPCAQPARMRQQRELRVQRPGAPIWGRAPPVLTCPGEHQVSAQEAEMSLTRVVVHPQGQRRPSAFCLQPHHASHSAGCQVVAPCVLAQ